MGHNRLIPIFLAAVINSQPPHLFRQGKSYLLCVMRRQSGDVSGAVIKRTEPVSQFSGAQIQMWAFARNES